MSQPAVPCEHVEERGFFFKALQNYYDHFANVGKMIKLVKERISKRHCRSRRIYRKSFSSTSG